MPKVPQVLLMIETSKAYGRGLLEGVGRYALAHGPWSIYLEERSLEDRLPPWVKDWRGDGIIVRGNSRAMARTLKQTGLPVVETDPRVTGFGLPFVYTDDRAVARLASDHFLERGLRNLAYCDVSGMRWSAMRREAFVAELTGRKLACDVFRLEARMIGANWQKQRQHLIRWVRSLPKPVGILAENDICGHRLLDACRFINVAVPEEVAVLGVDNDLILCHLAAPRLSSVDLNVERIGYEAAALLHRMMSDRRRNVPGEIFIEPLGVTARQSTDVLAIEDTDVAHAARYIREHACRGIGVKDVLQAVPLSRRVLERRFRSCLGKSPKDEIMRVRLNRARELLSQTDLSVAAIAAQVGFSSLNYLSNVFRRELGVSPRQYREQNRVSAG